VGPLNSLWPLVSVANEVIKPHDIFDATEESPLDLTFCQTILLVSRTHTQLPAVPRAVQSFQYANAQFTRRHPRIEDRVLNAPIHMGICSYRTPNLSLSIATSCALRPKHSTPLV